MLLLMSRQAVGSSEDSSKTNQGIRTYEERMTKSYLSHAINTSVMNFKFL